MYRARWKQGSNNSGSDRQATYIQCIVIRQSGYEKYSPSNLFEFDCSRIIKI